MLCLGAASLPFGEGEGYFCVGPSGDSPVCEVIWQGSGTVLIEICTENEDSAVTMTMISTCTDRENPLSIQIGPSERKCQCCKITETKICIPKNSGEICGNYETNGCPAPSEG